MNMTKTTTEDQASFENAQDEERTVYEIGYLVLPSIPEDSLDSLVSKITNSFEKLGGTRIDGEASFLRPLAYEMSKQVGARKYVVEEAYLGWIKFELEPSLVEAVKAEVEKMEEILRLLLIKAPRETGFTFEAARKALEDAEAERNAPVEAQEPAVAEVIPVVE